MTSLPNNRRRTVSAWWIAILVVFALGLFLRVHPFETIKGPGFDETVYTAYVVYLVEHGIWSYPTMVREYVETLKTSSIVFLPPTRALFLITAALWQQAFSVPAIEAVRAVSCVSSILTLALSGFVAGRLGGWRAAFGVLALMAFAPTQISIAHRAFIDGFFGLLTLLAIWSLWESLQQPKSRWCWMFGLSLGLLVLTKENAAFVYTGMLVLIGASHWLKFGQVSLSLLIATVVGPLAGVGILAVCAGSVSVLVSVYWQNVTMNYVLPYALSNQDGPWFRYLSDLILVSPAVMLLAIGGAFIRTQRGGFSLFLILFIVVTYVFMGNIRYGINLRFANMWDFPLRWLAMVPILIWTEKFVSDKARYAFYFGTVITLCLFELFNYLDIFVHRQVYDPISINLMKALDMIK